MDVSSNEGSLYLFEVIITTTIKLIIEESGYELFQSIWYKYVW